ncbi:MAG: spore maturation protein [Firmicutes bacterium]|nr:spore maturation protein [Bacillota bacterium]
MFSQFIIPFAFLLVLLIAIFRKKDPYNYFIDGSKKAVNLVIDVFPYLLAILMAVEVFRVSGVSAFLAGLTAPVFGWFGLPVELTELLIIRPLSGAGSLAVLNDIFANHEPDSFIGRSASVVYGSSETIFYVSTIYLSQSKCRNLRYAIPISIVATLTGVIAGVALLRVF